MDQFWKKWYKVVFPSLVPSYKWKTSVRNLEEDDVVLIYKEGIKRGCYPLGRVKKTYKSSDGFVRKADILYMSGDTQKTFQKAVSSLVVIIPTNYQHYMDTMNTE